MDSLDYRLFHHLNKAKASVTATSAKMGKGSSVLGKKLCTGTRGKNHFHIKSSLYEFSNMS